MQAAGFCLAVCQACQGAYRPDQVLGMRYDWCLVLLQAARELMMPMERTAGEGTGGTGAIGPTRRADGTVVMPIGSMDDLRRYAQMHGKRKS